MMSILTLFPCRNLLQRSGKSLRGTDYCDRDGRGVTFLLAFGRVLVYTHLIPLVFMSQGGLGRVKVKKPVVPN
jgi:hypothetical protein